MRISVRSTLLCMVIAAPVMAQSNDAQDAINDLVAIERSYLAGDPRVPEPIQAYNHCIIPKIQYGQFSSYDGGKSSLKLEAQCLDEARTVIDDCAKRAGGESDLCKVTPAYLAQVALKLLNK
jgi:hypothetical protein